MRSTRCSLVMMMMMMVTAMVVAAISVEAVELEIVTASGAPMPGAHVTVVGRRGMIVADEAGRCTLEPTPATPFVLVVARADGVALRPVTITEVPGSGPLKVQAQPMSEVMTVVAGAVPDLVLAPASAASVLTRADLDQRQPTSLPEVLETVPGGNVGGEGQSAVPSLRGLPKFRTLLLLDDGRVTTERRAGPSASYLDPDTLDEIEVVRGPGSVAYGSDAFGGIIRMRSRMPQPGQGLGLRYHVWGSEGTGGIGASADVTTELAGGGLLVGAHARDLDDYSSPEGDVYNTGHREQGLQVGWQRQMWGGTLRLGWRTDLGRDVGKPAPDSRTSRSRYPEETSHRLNLAWVRPGPGAWDRLTMTLAWDDYRLVLDKDALDGDLEPISRARSDVASNGYTARLEAERPLGSARLVTGLDIHGRYGLQAVNRTYETVGGTLSQVASETSIESASSVDWGGFAALSRDWDAFGLAAGVRYDLVETSSTGGFFGDASTSDADALGFVSARLSLGTGAELVGQVSRGFRTPTLSDRYYSGLTGRGTITGNPGLGSESSLQYDLALRSVHGQVSYAVYGYRYRIDDMIERYRDINRDYRFRNRGSAELEGLELELALELEHGLGLDLGATWARGEIRQDGSATDDIPTPGGYLRLRGHGPARLSWALRGTVLARDDEPGPNEQVLPGRAVLDGTVAWALGTQLELRLVARNLLDRAYLGSADEDAVLAPGRTLVLGLRGTL